MVWTIFGYPYENASDMTDTSIFQPVVIPDNIIVKGFRTWIAYQGDPTYTDINMKIYSNLAGSPAKLLHTSTDSRTKAEIQLVEDHGIKEIYFTFDDINLRSGDTYHVVLNGTGYSPTASSFLIWRAAWPDPVYTTNYTPTTSNLTLSPKFLSAFIAADL